MLKWGWAYEFSNVDALVGSLGPLYRRKLSIIGAGPDRPASGRESFAVPITGVLPSFPYKLPVWPFGLQAHKVLARPAGQRRRSDVELNAAVHTEYAVSNAKHWPGADHARLEVAR